MLDGDSLFPHLASLHLFLHYDDGIADAVVVGIAYGSFDAPRNRRRHDFTDGADAFSRFLEQELIPRVEARVRAEPQRRILFGQSRGGGYVLHSAFTKPDLFWGRIASNPTLDFLPSLHRRPAATTRTGLRLLVTSGARDRPQYREPVVRWLLERGVEAHAIASRWEGEPEGDAEAELDAEQRGAAVADNGEPAP